MTTHLEFDILPQPTDSSCGPTCLHAVYRYYGDDLPLERVIEEVQGLSSGGTLGVLLGCHALERGYRATLYTYNLHVFDPSWFAPHAPELDECLRRQAAVKVDPKLRFATDAYLRFLDLGGTITSRPLEPALLRRHLRRGEPVLTGLSATYLYGCAREVADDHRMRYDDIRGEPQGHFVVLYGYDPDARQVKIADPLHDNPAFRTHRYAASLTRVTTAIGLGILTYDANLLVVSPRDRSHR